MIGAFRFQSTLAAILKSPEKGGLLANNLVFRYNAELVDDGVGGEEGGMFSRSTLINSSNIETAVKSFLIVYSVGRRGVRCYYF